ncbi:MAG: G5 domain-containing protein [Lachnospiraceae bacterium]|nr:G5 domain-containing protein [Lachnospiraceae bacterium]MDY5742353.1 G5 domain-containing protein [Lachnospiraceae bacterium]
MKRKRIQPIRWFAVCLAMLVAVQTAVPAVIFAEEQKMTVAEFVAKPPADKTTVQVEGYVIGSEQNKDSNLKLGASADESSTVYLPVELKKGKWRDGYSPIINPLIKGKKVRVTGKCESYYGKKGLKSVTNIETLTQAGDEQPGGTDSEKPDSSSDEEADSKENPETGSGTEGEVQPNTENPVPEGTVTIEEARKKPVGTQVQIQGVIISPAKGWNHGFFVQDQSGYGLFVYFKQASGAKMGDIVTIKGVLQEFKSTKMLQLQDATLISRHENGNIPAATDIAIENLSSAKPCTLITLKNVIVQNLDQDQKNNPELLATDGKGHSIKVRIDKKTEITLEQLKKLFKNGDTLDITGILAEFQKQPQLMPFTLDHFKVVKVAEEATPEKDYYTVGEIQGAGHHSPYNQFKVKVKDVVVTKVQSSSLFYIQDITPDDDSKTSDALVVYKKDHNVAVGDQLEIQGKVDERKPQTYGGKLDDEGLTTTQIAASRLTKIKSNVSLPAPVVITDRSIPKQVIDNDGMTVFDPEEDSLDYWESLEGMLVEMDSPKIIGPQQYGDIYVLPQDTTNQLNQAGGYTLQPNQNPDVICLTVNKSKSTLDAKTGDYIKGRVTGTVTYSFGAFKIYVAEEEIKDKIVAGGLKREKTTIKSAEDKLTIASYNVENFTAVKGNKGTSDEKVNRIAESMVSDLGSPDIITLLEMQDDNGPTDNGVTSAKKSAKRLTDAIKKHKGRDYQYVDIEPKNNQDGGADGANIRVGMLYDPKRVTYISHEAVGADQEIFYKTRKSLAVTFEFQGQKVLVIGNHLNSKRGDSALFGKNQPATFKSDEKRKQLAQIVYNYAEQRRAADPQLHMVMTGDFNDFEFKESLHLLEGNLMVNLVEDHPFADRFSYFYRGNSQTLDHILVSKELVAGATFDMIHINSMFMEAHGRASDHDPVMVQLDLNKAGESLPWTDLEDPIITARETRTEEIDFNIIDRDTDELPKGEMRVAAEGRKGVRTVIEEVKTRSGKELSRKELSREITVRPEDRIVEHGTKIATDDQEKPDDRPQPESSLTEHFKKRDESLEKAWPAFWKRLAGILVKGFQSVEYDIYFMDADGKKVTEFESPKTVSLTIEGLEIRDAAHLYLYHRTADGSFEQIPILGVDGQTVRFASKSFSPYVFVYGQKQQRSSGSITEQTVSSRTKKGSVPQTGTTDQALILWLVLGACLTIGTAAGVTARRKCR